MIAWARLMNDLGVDPLMVSCDQRGPCSSVGELGHGVGLHNSEGSFVLLLVLEVVQGLPPIHPGESGTCF